MSSRLTVLDWVMIALILMFTAFHAVMLGGVFYGERAQPALAVSDPSLLPSGNAPGVEGPSVADRAEADDSAELPGTFVPSQGKRHTGTWPLRNNERVPYCEPGAFHNECYASNPPTSGLHVPVQRGAQIADGVVTLLPPDPGVYDFDLPREAVPHIQEHAGVFVGYNCASDECRTAVLALERVVIQELGNGARVVMSAFSDLPPDTIGLASWTRVDTFAAAEYDELRVGRFIRAHSCRFDPEGFCRDRGQQS
jgi:hypothetical protein